MNKKVSIIIPVYNGEKYIKKCLDSVVIQTYNNIEIIVVNDGSTDNSKNIINNYKKNDKRFLIINQNNSGVSSARNKGLLKASGEYVMFVDIDDYIDRDYVQELVEAIETSGSDIVVSSYKEIRGSNLKKVEYNKESIFIDNEEFKFSIITKMNFSSIWHTLFRKRILKDKYFNRNLKYVEDWLYMFDVALNKKIYYINSDGYNYLINNGSAMHNYNIKNAEKYLEDNKFVLNYISGVVGINYNNYLFQRMFTKINYFLIKLCYSKECDYKYFKKRCKSICNDYNFRNIDLKYMSSESFINKFRLVLLKYKIFIFYYLINRLFK